MSDTPINCLAQIMPSAGRTCSAATPTATRASPVRSQARYVRSFASSASVFGRDPSPTTATLPLWISSGLGLLAGKLGVGFATVARIWRGWNLQPWRVETFNLSTDPQLEAKVRDVVGLCLHPPENAVVLCLDEKSRVQALQRTAPILPIMPGVPEKATHDYIRSGTTTLFAALEVATGKALPNFPHLGGNLVSR